MGQRAHDSFKLVDEGSFIDDIMSEQRPEGDTEVSQADSWEKSIPEERSAYAKHPAGRRAPIQHV